jgi:hypothetical protein
MYCIDHRLKSILPFCLFLIPFISFSQGKYIKLILGSEFAMLPELKFEPTFQKSGLENGTYDYASSHLPIFGISYMTSKDNNRFWEISFIPGINSPKQYFIQNFSFSNPVYAIENRHNYQLNFSWHMFPRVADDRNLHYGLGLNLRYRYRFGELIPVPGTGLDIKYLKLVDHTISFGIFPRIRLQMGERFCIEMNSLWDFIQIGSEYKVISNSKFYNPIFSPFGNLMFYFTFAYQIQGKSIYFKR